MKYASAFGPAAAQAGENIAEIRKKISELNPEAPIIMQTVYNPFETDNEKCKFMYFPIELNEKQLEASIRKSIELNKHVYSLYNQNKDLIIVRIGEDQCLMEQLCENFVRIRCFDINEEKEIW